MLVQYLNFQSELKQHLMMSLFFLSFILYSLYNQLGINLWIIAPLIIICIASVFLILRNQTKFRKQVQVQVIEPSNKFKVVKRRLSWVVLPFILYTLLTAVHFYIVYLGSGNYIPMIYDYGVGGLLAIVFNFYLFKNWNIGICDEGIIIGSKLDAKLIKWELIESNNNMNSKVELILVNTSIKRLYIEGLKEQENFIKLLNYKSV